MDKELLLVSGSPRRRELLTMIDVQFEVYNADIDESRLVDESPQDYVLRLAVEKALAGLAATGTALPALGADTIVLLDGRILGKPVDRAEAQSMLQSLAGREHQVLTAVAVARDAADFRKELNVTRVVMGDIPAPWVAAYAQMDEPMDKAGAYAVQGLAGQWIKHVDGSYSGVMGLPLFETAKLLRWAGLPLLGQA